MILTELLNVLKELEYIPRQCEEFKKFIKKYYVPKYYTRTPKEHDEIRKRIKKNPETCDHLKGGPFRRTSDMRDYNLSLFTFITGKKRIRCLSCGKKWFPEDPDWASALEKFYVSTNGANSSEIPPGDRR